METDAHKKKNKEGKRGGGRQGKQETREATSKWNDDTVSDVATPASRFNGRRRFHFGPPFRPFLVISFFFGGGGGVGLSVKKKRRKNVSFSGPP